jgi:hypothetical protein
MVTIFIRTYNWFSWSGLLNVDLAFLLYKSHIPETHASSKQHQYFPRLYLGAGIRWELEATYLHAPLIQFIHYHTRSVFPVGKTLADLLLVFPPAETTP